jgi:hypothetical protein
MYVRWMRAIFRPGANPTTVVLQRRRPLKITTSRVRCLERFENKNIFFFIENALAY